MTVLIYLLLCGLAGAIARRAQGLSASTWPLPRSYRMLVLWGPVAFIVALPGFLLFAAPWWLALGAGLAPGLFAWLPGRHNSFWLHDLSGGRIPTAWTEGLNGGMAGLAAAGVLVAATSLGVVR